MQTTTTVMRAALVLGAAAVISVLGVRFAADLQSRRQLDGVDVRPDLASPDVDVPPPLPRLTPTFEGRDAERKRIAVDLVPIVTGVGQPTDVAFVPGHPHHMVVLSKWGSVHLVDLDAGTREQWIWLEVSNFSELGVLGIAFDPGFITSGRFWINHAPKRAETDLAIVVTEFRVDPATLAQPARVADILEVHEPYGRHNGGQLAFGPDGMLYVGYGDGGAQADADNMAQDRSSMLGSVIRIDVSEPGGYRVPADNPFVGIAGVRPEIWAFGLRNPWRFTFDPRGRLVVADVGESSWEEIDLVEAGDNLGWRVREGAACFDPPEDCPIEGLVDPIYTYAHDEGISITGGVVWTGSGPLHGRYVFGDFGLGRLWALSLPDRPEPAEDVVALGQFDLWPSAFARDADGRVWVADFKAEAIYRLEPAGLSDRRRASGP